MNLTRTCGMLGPQTRLLPVVSYVLDCDWSLQERGVRDGIPQDLTSTLENAAVDD